MEGKGEPYIDSFNLKVVILRQMFIPILSAIEGPTKGKMLMIDVVVGRFSI